MKIFKLLFLLIILINFNSISYAEKDCSMYSTNTVMGNYNKKKCEQGIEKTKKLTFKEKLKLLNPLKKKKND